MNSYCFLSVVIPVYNGARTISRCLESIWEQEMDEAEYEVICVDDCSTDDTVQTVRRIQREHPNLRLFRNAENLRAGGSRNHGVREAAGDYVVFIDADDYFHPGTLRECVSYQKKMRLDILMCDFCRHAEERPNNRLVLQFPSSDVMSGYHFMLANSLPYGPCKYFFSKKIMLDNSIYFSEKVCCEDVDWCIRLALAARTMQYKPWPLSHYVLYPQSQTGDEFRKPATVYHRLFCGYRVYGLLSLCRDEDEKRYILSVADATYKNGVIFLNALISNPFEKAEIIRQYIPEYRGGVSMIVRVARKFPLGYSIFSTLVAPVFRLAVACKRKIKGR